MIRKKHFKAEKITSVNTKVNHLISKKLVFGQAVETCWPIEEEYFFEAEDY